MAFTPHKDFDLKLLNLKENNEYTIEYLDRDYFNGVEKVEIAKGKLILDQKGSYIFLIKDDYGMDKFIKKVRVIF
jgi:hypothetical protein